MDTPTTATPDRRQASQPSQAATANGNGHHLPRQARHPATESGGKRLTRADVAALLGVSVAALRRLQSRANVPGTPEPREAGGSALVFTEADVAALRQASQATGAATESDALAATGESGDNRVNRACRDRRDTRQPSQARQAPEPTPHEAEGWRVALANMAAERDTLRAELAVARVDAQDARREAAEAMRALAATNERIGAMRAAWWRWRQQLETLGPLARWRKRWPVAPGEFEADPLLAAPVE